MTSTGARTTRVPHEVKIPRVRGKGGKGVLEVVLSPDRGLAGGVDP